MAMLLFELFHKCSSQIWPYIKFFVLRVFCHLDKNKFNIVMKGGSSVKRSYNVIYKGFHSFQSKSKSFQYTSTILQCICQNVEELSFSIMVCNHEYHLSFNGVLVSRVRQLWVFIGIWVLGHVLFIADFKSYEIHGRWKIVLPKLCFRCQISIFC